MPDIFTTLFIGAIGGGLASAIQYAFRRYGEAEQVRREVIETHLLQLQNSVESLYYRANNLRDWSGKSVMSEEYYLRTSAYILGRVLAHEALLVSKGVYAKIHRNTTLKHEVKAALHSLNWAMDDQTFLHYDRVQLGDMLLNGDQVINYTEFLGRWIDPAYAAPSAAVSRFLQGIESERLERIRNTAAKLVGLLAAETKVPSALDLAE